MLPIKKRPVLGKQDGEARCFNVVLRGANGQAATVRIRSDNVYLVGFKTQGGTWYAFKWDERYVPDNPTSLGFESDYGSLTGGHKNLGKVVLGKKSMQEAMATLATYTSSTAEKEIKVALTRLVVMLCEATRFEPITAAVKAAWEDGGKLPQVGVDLVVVWRETSCALLVWNRDQKKNWKEIPEVVRHKLREKGDPEMKSVDAAIDNIHVLLRPTEACSDGKTAALPVDF
jgi:hypothetical protein